MFRCKGCERLEFLHGDAQNLVDARLVHTITRSEDTGFFKPQPQGAHVFPAARHGEPALLQPLAELVEGDVLAGACMSRTHCTKFIP